MSESMFGPPSHLLPSQPQTGTGSSAAQSNPPSAPVPLQFEHFRFKSIGKAPDLLSRISGPQPDNTEYHSPTPSPIPTPPPISTLDFPKSTSRPSLLQQLVGSSFPSVDGVSGYTSQPLASLASRIQMGATPSNDVAQSTVSGLPSPLRISTARRPTEDVSLIPPVEVLPQPPGSSPTTPASWAPALEPDLQSSAFSTPLFHTKAITASQNPTPPIIIAPHESAQNSPSSAVVDAMLRDQQPSSSADAAIDSLVARQDRLQSISAMLANLAPPLPFSLQSPPADQSSAARASTTPDQPTQSQRIPTPVVLHHPYPTNQISARMRLSADATQTHTADPSLALVPSSATLTQDYQAQSKAIVAAIQNLTLTLDTAHRVQVDNENALALRARTFEEQRVSFEQTRRAEETTLQQEFQELQKKREELNAKEALLASLEKESKAREEARKGILAKRQAQEEEKRAAEAKRVQEVQEQLSAAINELKEIEALKAKCQVFQLGTEIPGGDLPIEPQEGMNEDEKAAIKSRNELLCAVKHLRRMHTDKSQKLEETNRTLRSLGEERKTREAEEAERHRIAEEERLRVHAEMERARQRLDERRRQVEAEKKRQELENNREQARLLVKQAHAEAQVNAPQRQRTADTPGIHVAPEESSFSQETTNAMNVDHDSAPSHTVSSSDAHPTPGASQSKQKMDKPGVILTGVTTKASGERLPLKPPVSQLRPPSVIATNTPNMPVALPVVSIPSPLPLQPAPGSNRASADVRATPDYKSAFSRTPKSQTILDLTNGPNQELNINIGPLAGVSPTQQNVNLRHLKRFRSRAEGNESGDRSARTIPLKNEENSPRVKEEKEDVKASFLTLPPASLPPRPAVIPPPRPRALKKPAEAPAVQTDSYLPESNALSSTKRGVEVTVGERFQEVPPKDTRSSQAINAPAQLPVPSESMSSLLLAAEPRASEFRFNTGERPIQDQNSDTTPSEPASATLSHDGEDSSKNNRRFSDEHRRARKATGSRRVTDHYSPPFPTSRPPGTSPTQPHRPVDTWRPQNPPNRPRAEPMRATSPTTGRKRPPEFSDNEYGHRARRQRADVWNADSDRDRVDSYRPQRDRRLDPEFDERRGAHRVPISPVDRTRTYPSDMPRTTYDNRTSEESTAPAAHLEQIYRRAENEDTLQRYQAAAPVYGAMTDQYYTDDSRSGQTYESMAEESMETRPELLARIHDIQSFPPRGRGRGDPNRGRGRGRGMARGGTPLLERLTSAPVWKTD